MSEVIDEEVKARLREFNIELELLIASMLQRVPITAIQNFYKGKTMAEVVAGVLRPVRAGRGR